MLRFHILGLLRTGEACHGYALMKEYSRRTGRDYGGAGNFYRQLADLAEMGFVRPSRKILGADPRRTPYEITPAGIEAFDDWFEETPREPLGRDVIRMARAMFAVDMEPHLAARVLARWQSDLADQARGLERALVRAKKRERDDRDVRSLLIERDLARVASDLAFLDAVGQRIQSRAGDWLCGEARSEADPDGA